MTFFTQLTPPIPVFARDQPGLAHGVIDYGPEHDLYWVVFCKDGEVWTLKNKEVRGQENVTEERTKTATSTPADSKFSRYFSMIAQPLKG